jgi:pimeloyl-ACP methyl ester carboxylesterase
MNEAKTTNSEINHKAGHMELGPGVAVYVRIFEPANYVKTVLCLHGAAGSSSDFDELAKALADDGCRVISYDRPGNGRSPLLQTIASKFTLSNLAIIKAFMKMPGGVDAVVCSSGGAAIYHLFWARVASKLNLKAPALAYCEPGFEMNDDVKSSIHDRLIFMEGKYATFEDARAAWLESGWSRVAFASETVRDDYLRNRLLKIDGFYRPAIHEKLLNSLRINEAKHEVDALRVNANFTRPLLLLHAADRAEYYQGRMPQLNESYKNITVHTVEGSHHPLSLTTDFEISLIRDFLKYEAQSTGSV